MATLSPGQFDGATGRCRPEYEGLPDSFAKTRSLPSSGSVCRTSAWYSSGDVAFDIEPLTYLDDLGPVMQHRTVRPSCTVRKSGVKAPFLNVESPFPRAKSLIQGVI